MSKNISTLVSKICELIQQFSLAVRFITTTTLPNYRRLKVVGLTQTLIHIWYNRTNEIHFFEFCFWQYPLYVSNRQAIHHQEVILYVVFGYVSCRKYIKFFTLYVVKNIRIVLYKIIYTCVYIYIYINVNIKRLLLKEIHKYIPHAAYKIPPDAE